MLTPLHNTTRHMQPPRPRPPTPTLALDPKTASSSADPPGPRPTSQSHLTLRSGEDPGSLPTDMDNASVGR
ncbi:hypothetical protein PTMSG1_03595 [Pyrenophora teres f. maculata]|nr:hypothetical protein PTMSG1_03595 [Pyrenophora teres f. maculata]